MLACAGNFAVPEPTVTLRDAEPGEYFVFIDGGGPEQWVSSGSPIQWADAHNAQQDLRDNCGWSDGGGDAFDCFGRGITLTFNGANSGEISPLVGRRQVNAGGYAAFFESDFPAQNIWRMRLTPAEDFDDRPVTFNLTGNLGSDGGTQGHPQSVNFNGRRIDYLVTNDGALDAAGGDPQVTHFMVTSDPEEIDRLTIRQVGGANDDDITYEAANVKLPLTIYIAIGQGAHGGAVQAILNDIEIQAGPAGNDAPRFGNFELSVTEE